MTRLLLRIGLSRSRRRSGLDLGAAAARSVQNTNVLKSDRHSELPEKLIEGDFDLGRHFPDGVGEECPETASFVPAAVRGDQVLIPAAVRRRLVTEVWVLLRLSMLLRMVLLLLVSVAAIANRIHFAEPWRRSFHRHRSEDHTHFAPSSSSTAVELSLSLPLFEAAWTRRTLSKSGPRILQKEKKLRRSPPRPYDAICLQAAETDRRAAAVRVGVGVHVAVCHSRLLRPARAGPRAFPNRR